MNPDAQHLIKKFWAGTATVADKQQLAALFGPNEDAWHERLHREFAAYPANTAGPLSEEQSARVLQQLRHHLATEALAATPRRSGWVGWAAAAILLFVSLAGLRWAYRPAAPMARVARPAGRWCAAPIPALRRSAYRCPMARW